MLLSLGHLKWFCIDMSNMSLLSKRNICSNTVATSVNSVMKMLSQIITENTADFSRFGLAEQQT